MPAKNFSQSREQEVPYRRRVVIGPLALIPGIGSQLSLWSS